jgi:hypothetical protein
MARVPNATIRKSPRTTIRRAPTGAIGGAAPQRDALPASAREAPGCGRDRARHRVDLARNPAPLVALHDNLRSRITIPNQPPKVGYYSLVSGRGAPARAAEQNRIVASVASKPRGYTQHERHLR